MSSHENAIAFRSARKEDSGKLAPPTQIEGARMLFMSNGIFERVRSGNIFKYILYFMKFSSLAKVISQCLFDFMCFEI